MSNYSRSIEFDVRVEDGDTVLEFDTTTAASVIVRSESGEEIYLPAGSKSKSSGPPSSYQPAADEDSSDGPKSSYRPGDDAETESDRTVGRTSTPGGFVVVHPEPVTDVRVVTP